jgi:hypothetical protein
VVSDTAKLESLLLANISCTHIYLEILQNIKYDITMIHYFMILCIVHMILYGIIICMTLVYHTLHCD